MENKIKPTPPLAMIESVKYVLVDRTEIQWVKTPGTFKVIRKLPGGPFELLESTDLSPTSECAYFLLNSTTNFKPTTIVEDEEIKHLKEKAKKFDEIESIVKSSANESNDDLGIIGGKIAHFFGYL